MFALSTVAAGGFTATADPGALPAYLWVFVLVSVIGMAVTFAAFVYGGGSNLSVALLIAGACIALGSGIASGEATRQVRLEDERVQNSLLIAWADERYGVTLTEEMSTKLVDGDSVTVPEAGDVRLVQADDGAHYLVAVDRTFNEIPLAGAAADDPASQITTPSSPQPTPSTNSSDRK